jgi:hypothetical protein
MLLNAVMSNSSWSSLETLNCCATAGGKTIPSSNLRFLLLQQHNPGWFVPSIGIKLMLSLHHLQ